MSTNNNKSIIDLNSDKLVIKNPSENFTGNVVLGDDINDIITLNGKVNIPGGETGQLLLKGSDGSLEYGPNSISTQFKTISPFEMFLIKRSHL